MEALLKAVETAGGTQAALAHELGFSGRQGVSPWFTTERKVSAEHCLEIEAMCRRIAKEKGDPSLIVTCEELRPDLNWQRRPRPRQRQEARAA